MARRYQLGSGTRNAANFDNFDSSDITITGDARSHLLIYCHTDAASDYYTTGANYLNAEGNIGQGPGGTSVYSFISMPAYPGSNSWETAGAEDVQISITATDADWDIRCRLLRVNSSGTIQDTGSWTSAQTMSVAIRNFAPAKPTWGTTALTDRLVLQVEFADTRDHGGTNTRTLILASADEPNNTYTCCYFETQVTSPDAGGENYQVAYELTNDASDLSTYTNNYVMNTTGESASSTITHTAIADSGQLEFGWITPSGTPNSANWTQNTEEMIFFFEVEVYNDATSDPADGGCAITARADRINSSGTIQESATVHTTTNLATCVATERTGSLTYYYFGISVPNKSWSAGAASDRLGIRCLFTNNQGESVDISIRVHDGTSQTGYLYSKIAEGAGTVPKIIGRGFF